MSSFLGSRPPTRSPVPPPQDKASFPFVMAAVTAARLARINMKTSGFTARLIGVADDSYYCCGLSGGNAWMVERERREERNGKGRWMMMAEQMCFFFSSRIRRKHLLNDFRDF